MLDPVEKRELKNKKITYEGNVPHMYLDTEGQVTIGIGHMMPSAAAAQKSKFFTRRWHKSITRRNQE